MSTYQAETPRKRKISELFTAIGETNEKKVAKMGKSQFPSTIFKKKLIQLEKMKSKEFTLELSVHPLLKYGIDDILMLRKFSLTSGDRKSSNNIMSDIVLLDMRKIDELIDNLEYIRSLYNKNKAVTRINEDEKETLLSRKPTMQYITPKKLNFIDEVDLYSPQSFYRRELIIVDSELMMNNFQDVL